MNMNKSESLAGWNYSRRDFMRAGALATAGLTFGWNGTAAQAALSMPATLDALPYAFDALEPHIDARTMEIHHGRHHAAYVRNLIQALEAHPDLQAMPLETLLARLPTVPDDVRTSVRNNGGGHYNHRLFWSIMAPDGGGAPDGELAKAIDEQFGSFDDMVLLFNQAAATQFGSGWAWLVTDTKGGLSVVATPNQDNPLMEGIVSVTGTPILGLDVWEHAYYLHYQNRRADYIKAWWNVVNWPEVARLYAERG
jgi:Fe-Mn family superoxide dismutase